MKKRKRTQVKGSFERTIPPLARKHLVDHFPNAELVYDLLN
jgi:hypothetical protein